MQSLTVHLLTLITATVAAMLAMAAMTNTAQRTAMSVVRIKIAMKNAR